MKLDVKGMAYAAAATWGLAVLCVGLINMVSPTYGVPFLELTASVYPGYHFDGSVGSVLVATGYGLVDGAIGGALLAWLYNRAIR